jgi:hypothetical protein
MSTEKGLTKDKVKMLYSTSVKNYLLGIFVYNEGNKEWKKKEG